MSDNTLENPKPLDLSIEDVRTVNMIYAQPIVTADRPVACCTSTVAINEDPERD